MIKYGILRGNPQDFLRYMDRLTLTGIRITMPYLVPA